MNYSDFLLSSARVLRTSGIEVERLIATAPYRYKHYTIAKRNGGRRNIHHPTPGLKVLQRWIVDELLSELHVHDSVYSYRIGRSIAMHASMHLASNFIVRMDFKNFFPSITAREVQRLFMIAAMNGRLKADERTIHALVRLVCRFDKASGLLALSIGAPSSPHISNALLSRFDELMTRRAIALDCVYTRYADDLYISGRRSESVDQLHSFALKTIGAELPFLEVNEKKTQNLSRKRRMTVTGVRISSERRISLGREVKRSIRSRVHLAIKGELDYLLLPELRGMLAHAKSIEPSFYSALVRKFGSDSIFHLMKSSDGVARPPGGVDFTLEKAHTQ